MTTAIFVLQVFLSILALAFVCFFIYFAVGSIPEKGYAPDMPDKALRHVVTLLVAIEVVVSFLAPYAVFNPPETTTIKFIDAGHADMTSYWVAVLVIILLTPILIPPVYWGLYWVFAGVCWLFKAPCSLFVKFVEWWGGLFFKSKK